MKQSNVISAIYEAFSNNFFRATIWMFIGTGVLSFGNYLYHLIMGRMLGPSEYGVLESIISFSYLLSVPLMTLNLIIVKYVSSHKGKGDYESISSLFGFLNKRFSREGIILCFILIILSPLITKFLHLSSSIYGILLVLFVFTGFFSNLGRGMLQGLSNFGGLAVVNTVESISKITLAVALVFIGLKSQGGLVGIVASAVLAYFSASFFLNILRKDKAKPFTDHHLIGKYTIPTFFTTLGMVSLFTTDVLLARHFLSAEQAGFYAALSVLGKVVFFAVSPISLVMFPFVSERHSKGEKYSGILIFSLLLTITGAAIISAFYYLFPEFVVGTLFGSHFLPIGSLAWLFGIFVGLYSICFLLANFFLSIHKTFPTILIAFVAVLQIAGIYFYHGNIIEIVTICILITFLLLICLLLYYANEIYRK